MSTAIVWFRNDLRLTDNPALAEAAESYDAIVPVFIFDPGIIGGRHTSPNRLRFLLECLADIAHELEQLGNPLIIRQGAPAEVLAELAARTSATAVLAAADYSPFARRRDEAVAQTLQAAHCQLRLMPGRLMVDDPAAIVSGSGQPFQVFTPFYNRWVDVPRRPVVAAPSRLPAPPVGLTSQSLPSLESLAGPTAAGLLAPQAQPGGAAAARQQLKVFLSGPVQHYHELHDDLAAGGTSRLSAYLHFGCVSPREVEAALPDGESAAAFRRQLAWRDFYHYVLLHHPANAKQEFQARYRNLVWTEDAQLQAAWETGHTGYPMVDAAMRELLQTGYMHNRARLIVGSFLTKDLGLDWRVGETYFMRHLIDGDEANNNGNWQWIASVGVDPAPVFRRLYNPTSQAARYDPTGQYIRRWVPELADVPAEYLYEPWRMTPAQQSAAKCRIGEQYPAPVVDHAVARAAALERYRLAGA